MACLVVFFFLVILVFDFCYTTKQRLSFLDMTFFFIFYFYIFFTDCSGREVLNIICNIFLKIRKFLSP